MTDVNKKDTRIPTALRAGILGGFAATYLQVVDEIAEYNKQVLAEKNSEWNAAKVLTKSEEFARPTDGSEANKDILEAREAWEELVTQVNLARRELIEKTSAVLGISLGAIADRDAAAEERLKEDRKKAVAIASNLETMSKMMAGDDSDVIKTFLENNSLPQVGRDGSKTFGSDTPTTTKWRVTVEVKKGDTVLGTFDGFTKAGLAMTKPEFGYARGEALTSEQMREVWESKNKDKDNITEPVVEFTHNDLHFTITKK